MFESGKYSDLTIICGPKSYPVHRALLASRSSFFEGACNNPFQESETGRVDLTHDDPDAVEYMLHCEHHQQLCIVVQQLTDLIQTSTISIISAHRHHAKHLSIRLELRRRVFRLFQRAGNLPT